MSTASFEKAVSAWVAKAPQRILDVRLEALQDLVEIMQEPGFSKARVAESVSAGDGLGKVKANGRRGVSKKAFGPVTSGQTGNLPVDSGFLRASFVAAPGRVTLPTTEKPEGDDRAYAWDSGPVGLVLLRTPVTEAITLGYTAAYARHVEYGSHGQRPRMFVSLALQRWPQILAGAGARVAARDGGPTHG